MRSNRLLPPFWVMVLALGALGGLAIPAQPLEAQVVVGRTIDSQQSTPVGRVELRIYSGERLVTRAMSDDEGWFRAPVPGPGTYRISAFVFGYEPQDSIRVEVPDLPQITLAIRLAQRVLMVQGIEVTAEREQARYLLSWTGFERRREDLPPIGNARAVNREDPEMRSATSLQEILQWFPRPSGGAAGRLGGAREVLYYLDGFPVTEEQILSLPFVYIAGVEYYRYGYDSPVGGGTDTVIMIWRDPPPKPPGGGGGRGEG
jgi:hypothetical protein